jgi:hypothetical protein
MPKAQRILTVIGWAAPAVSFLAFFLWASNVFHGLGWDIWNASVDILWAIAGGSLVVGFVSSLVAFGLSLGTRKGRILALLPVLGIAALSWYVWQVATHIAIG